MDAEVNLASNYSTYSTETNDYAEIGLVPRLNVQSKDAKRALNCTVKLVACNPAVCGEAAVAFKDGALMLCRHGAKPETIQDPTGFFPSSIAWNDSGTALAVVYAGTKTSLDVWSRQSQDFARHYSDETAGRFASARWTLFEDRDVIQIVVNDKFYAKDLKSNNREWNDDTALPEQSLATWYSNVRFSIRQFVDGCEIHLYRVDLRNEKPLTLLSTLKGSEGVVHSLAGSTFGFTDRIAAIDVRNLLVWGIDADTNNDESHPASVKHVRKNFSKQTNLIVGLEWLGFSVIHTFKLARYSGTNVVLHEVDNQRREKAFNLGARVVGIKYSAWTQALFVATEQHLTIIDAQLKQIRLDIVRFSSCLTAFDVSRGTDGRVYAVLGDLEGNVTFVRIKYRD